MFPGKFSDSVFLTIAILGGAVVCSGDALNRNAIPLKLYELPSPKSSSPFDQADLEVVNAFKKKYPDIELSSFSGITIAGQAMDSKVLLAIAGGSAPDILYVNFRQSHTYISRGFLYPLDGFVRRDFKEQLIAAGGQEALGFAYDETIREVLGHDGLNRIATPVWPVLQRPGPEVMGIPGGTHLWAIPWNVEVRALFFRRDVFEEAGINPNRPPKNWNEMYEYAKRICDPAQRRYGMELMAGDNAAWDFMPYLWSAGGDAVQFIDGEWIATFNSDAAVTALDFYLKLTSEAWLDPDGNIQRGYTTRSGGTDKVTAWSEGRVGMRIGYMDNKTIAGNLDPALIGIAPFPAGPTGLRGTEINCSMMGMFSGIEDRRNAAGVNISAAEIREAAWRYIWFFGSEEAQRIRVDKLVDLGLGKMLNPKLLKKFGYDDYAKFVPREWMEVFDQALADGKAEPYGKNCQLVYSYMTEPIDDAIQLSRKTGFMDEPEPERRSTLRSLLDAAVKKTNEQMIGKLPPGERVFRNRMAAVVALVMLTIFCLVVYKVWKMFSPSEQTPQDAGGGWQLRRYAPAYMIMLPALGSIILWFYIPLLMGSRITFQDYSFMGNSTWVGFQNIADVLYSSDWWKALWNTFRYMFLLLGIGFFLPIVLAILLQEVSRGKIIYRVIYYLPAVMSGLVVIYMWKLFFQGDQSGVVNQVISGVCGVFGVNVEPVKWLEDSTWAMFCCVIPVIWAGTGPGCLIYLAALKGIPDDIYEAADIDGASFIRKVRHIVLPSLKALIIINFIGAFINASINSGMILVMTYGNADTEVAGLHIFKEAYTRLNFGTAISMSWILGISLLGFTVLQLRRLSRMEFKANTGEGDK